MDLKIMFAPTVMPESNTIQNKVLKRQMQCSQFCNPGFQFNFGNSLSKLPDEECVNRAFPVATQSKRNSSREYSSSLRTAPHSLLSGGKLPQQISTD
ncbi:hypothetical protein CEXT_261971 [Caerostris extrusa]|uniref:Uncharacterized protein n=1 Tax=Caerostris extrusa TaxID=172846 RepID=A0AAV4T1J9_CAEEX|nr:hypothetical protein CEXT_261971 [Caerostris extrusa]